MVFTNIGLAECLPIGKSGGLLHRLPLRVHASSAMWYIRNGTRAHTGGSWGTAVIVSEGHSVRPSSTSQPRSTQPIEWLWPNKQTEERANGLPNQQRFSLTVQKMHQNIITDEGIWGIQEAGCLLTDQYRHSSPPATTYQIYLLLFLYTIHIYH